VVTRGVVVRRFPAVRRLRRAGLWGLSGAFEIAPEALMAHAGIRGRCRPGVRLGTVVRPHPATGAQPHPSSP